MYIHVWYRRYYYIQTIEVVLMCDKPNYTNKASQPYTTTTKAIFSFIDLSFIICILSLFPYLFLVIVVNSGLLVLHVWGVWPPPLRSRRGGRPGGYEGPLYVKLLNHFLGGITDNTYRLIYSTQPWVHAILTHYSKQYKAYILYSI